MVFQQTMIILGGLFFIAVFSRLSSKEVLGQFQFVLSIFAFVSIISITGLNTSVIHSVSRGYEGSYKDAVKISFKWSILGLLTITFLGAYYLTTGQIYLGKAFILGSLFFPLFYAFNTWKAYYQGKSEFKLLTRNNILQNWTAIILTSIVIFFNGKSLIPILLVYLGSIGFSNLYFYLRSVRNLKTNSKDSDTIKYGWFLTYVEAWVILGDNIDKIAVGALLGPENLAVYTIISLIPTNTKGIFKSFSSIFFPKLARLKESFSEMIVFHRKNIIYASIILALISFFYYLLIIPVSFLLFSEKYGEFYWLSRIYIILIFLSVPLSFLSYNIKAKKDKTAIIITGPVFNIIKTVITVAFILKYKLLGAIIGYNLSAIIGFLLYLSCSLEGKLYKFLSSVIYKFKNNIFEKIYYYFQICKVFEYSSKVNKNKLIIENKGIENNYDFHKIKKSDTIFIFGSGWSINEIDTDQWGYFKKHNTIAFNWFLRGDFIPIDYYIVSEITKTEDYQELKDHPSISKYKKCLNKPCYKDSYIFLNLNRTSSRIILEDELLSKRRFKFFRNKVNNFLHFSNSFDKIFHGNASLNDSIHIAYLMGFKKIVLVGVDLYDRRYFWLEKDQTREGDKKRGALCTDKHSYANRAVKIMKKIRKILNKKGVEMYIYNKKSLLNTCLPIYKIDD